MLAKWLQLLEQHSWHTPLDEIVYCTTAEDADYRREVLIDGKIIKRLPRKKGYKVLGTFVTFDNSFDVELGRRISAAWSAFSKYSGILKAKCVPLEARLSLFAKTVNPALFWCAGSWTLRKDQLATLRGVQRRMLRKIIGFQKGEDEDIELFMQRSNRTINNLIARHNVKLWDNLSHRAVYGWAGKVARINIQNPDRWTSKVFLYRNWDWIQIIASNNSGRQLHGRYLKAWRWERPIYKFFGTNWHSKAAHEDDWASEECDFLRWRAINR